jgi:hypothetical protein
MDDEKSSPDTVSRMTNNEEYHSVISKDAHETVKDNYKTLSFSYDDGTGVETNDIR